jgi:hypothetical protein
MSREHGLIFRGRIDHQAKIRGYRVELLEVENAMRVAAETDTVGAVPWPIGAGYHGRPVAVVAGGSPGTISAFRRSRLSRDKLGQKLAAKAD